MRKCILFIAEAATLAHVVRLIVLAKTLDPKRYDIHFACAPGYERFFEETNFTMWPIQSISQQQFLQAIAKGATPYKESILRNYIRDDLNVLANVQPHLIIGDNRFSLAISAPLTKVPYAALVSAHWSPYSPLTRLPMPVPEFPAVNLIGLTTARLFARWIQPIMFHLFAKPVNRLRQHNGLPKLGSLIHVLTEPGDYTLYADTPVFSPTTNLPTNHRYIGPILWSPEQARPNWWDKLTTDRPSVYLTLGSSGLIDLLPMVVQTLAKLPLNILVATAGRLPLGRLPDNVWAADYLPGTLAAQRANLVICNGGSGTVHQALSVGTPILGIASNMDQHLVMRCVTQQNAGLLLRAGNTQSEKVMTAVISLLENTDYQIAARRIAVDFAHHDVTLEFPRFVAEAC